MKKIKRNKGVKFLLLGAIIASVSLMMLNPAPVAAAEVKPEVAQLLSDQVRLASGISYIDVFGTTKEIAIPPTAQVQLNATATQVVVQFNGQTHRLTNVREITFKNILVSRLVKFHLNGVKKVTLEGVTFQMGIDFSGMRDVETIIVKNSRFGFTGYSLAIHGSPYLSTVIVDSSGFMADLRIYSNKSLGQATVSNSVLQDDAIQHSNQSGFHTNYINTRFERPNGLRSITSGGKSAADIFFMNPNGNAIAATRYNGSLPGKIIYFGSDGVMNTIDVPAYTPITKVDDRDNTITINLENGYSTVLNDVRELYFRNVDIRANVSFTSRNLRLEKLIFVDCVTRLIDVAHSDTMKSFELHRTEVSQSSGFVSVYNNKVFENFIIQDSAITGSAGYISAYNIPTMRNFIMNNTFTYGYLQTHTLGAAVFKLSNSRFHDFISSTNVIEGEADIQPVGYLPTIETGPTRYLVKGAHFDALDGVYASDVEDGDITSSVTVDDSNLNYLYDGDYDVHYTATDSDGNTVTITVIVTVGPPL